MMAQVASVRYTLAANELFFEVEISCGFVIMFMVFLDWTGDFLAKLLPRASSFANGNSRRVTAHIHICFVTTWL
jgi:hypothetical protein